MAAGEQAVVALRRLLAEAGASEQARVDALVALSQRSLLAAIWSAQNPAVRTLTNASGETAMPLFTAQDTLDATAQRFGWRDPDGALPARAMPAHEALRHAVARGVHFVVIDVGAPHAIEVARAELESLLALPAGGTAGPYAATGPAQEKISEAVRRSTRPPPVAGVDIDLPFAQLKREPPPRISTEPAARAQPPSRPLRARVVSQPLMQPVRAAVAERASAPQRLSAADARRMAESLTGEPSPEAEVIPPPPRAVAQAPAPEPPEAAAASDEPDGEPERESGEQATTPSRTITQELLQLVSQGLRSFPEVEWACVLPEADGLPVIGVRVDPSFLNRLADITDLVVDAGQKQGVELQVLLLNTTDLVKSARARGKAFYPWKR